MLNQNNVIPRLLSEAPPDPTVVTTLDFTVDVLIAISNAVPKGSRDLKAIQHYLDMATVTLRSCKQQHAKITP